MEFRDALRSLSVPGKVVLSDGRATYLARAVEKQIGVKANRFALEVTLIPRQDDGWPKLTFLIFEVDPSFGAHTAEAINEFVRSREHA